MSTSSGRDDNWSGSKPTSEGCAGAIEHFVRASQLLNNEHTAEPREEPYLEPTYLDKPILDIYEPNTDDDYQLLESDENSWAWIRAPKSEFVDVEGAR